MIIENNNGTVICRIDTNLVASNVREISESIREAFEKHTTYDEIVLDLSKVRSIDSMGITFLIKLYRKYCKPSAKVRLEGVSAEMYKIFKMLKLTDIFSLDC